MDRGTWRDVAASRRALLLGLAGLAAVPLVGCAKEPEVAALLTADGVARRAAPGGAPVEEAIAGLTAFGHRFLMAAAKPGENFISSPLSLAVAFAMLRVGAGGATAKELDTVFGFPATDRDGAYNALTAQVANTEIPPPPDKSKREAGEPPRPPVVSIGNALFPKKGFAIGEPFLKTLALDYGAGVRPVDFGDEQALKLINGWADRQTAGRIKQVFDRLDAATKLVLANTVYFKADWQHTFAPPMLARFTKADGSVVQAPTLGRTANTRYAESGGVTAVEIAYAAGPYAMWLMLPPAGAQPEQALRPETAQALRGAFTDAVVAVSFPAFDFETPTDLLQVLPKMGLASTFGAGADFSGIAAGLSIDQAVHKANITVDDWGTEAAAVTALSMPTSGPPEPQKRFIADRPFAFAIVAGKDKVPLFTGVVADPTAK